MGKMFQIFALLGEQSWFNEVGRIFETFSVGISARLPLQVVPQAASNVHFLHFFNERIINRHFCLLRLIGWSVILAYQIETQVQPMTIAASQERHVQVCKEYWIAGHSLTNSGIYNSTLVGTKTT